MNSMPSGAQRPSNQFRRLLRGVSNKEILVPHLEVALLRHGENVWPEAYEIRVHNKERQWDGFFHPSTHANMGELRLFYEFSRQDKMEYPRLTVDDVLTFQVGSAYHALVQSMLIHMGFTTPDEVEAPFVNEHRWCSGRIDVRRCWVPEQDSPVLLDIKSAAYLPKSPPMHYQKQIQVYLDLAPGGPMQRGIILYLTKQAPHKLREFVVERDQDTLDEIYGRWNRVREAIEFDDASTLRVCCNNDTTEHRQCPARFQCRIGPPTIRSKR